jgi:uncharacterized protein YciI
MFIVLVRYPNPDAVDAHRPGHYAFIQRLVDEGIILMSGAMVPRVGGAIVAKIDSRERLEALLDEDPFKIAGVATYEIIEFFARNGSLTSVLDTA